MKQAKIPKCSRSNHIHTQYKMCYSVVDLHSVCMSTCAAFSKFSLIFHYKLILNIIAIFALFFFTVFVYLNHET